MKERGIIKKSIELFLFSLLLGGINLYFFKDPGFLSLIINPYFILAMIVSSYYGKYFGLLSLFYSGLTIFVLFPLSAEALYYHRWQVEYWITQYHPSLLPFALALIGIYIFGIIRDSFSHKIYSIKERLRKISREKGILQKRIKSIEIVGRELEERLIRQEDSITELYNRIQSLYSLNFFRALEAILDTVQKFSKARKASIWEYSPDSKELRLATSLGWSETESSETVLPVENTIEGWVVRNNIPFSIKMLQNYENLLSMDVGRNIITLPINVGRQIWGILNIEDLPFERYNLYTEEILQLILSLAGLPLEKALDYESVIQQAETHPITGIPAFSQFYSLLQKEINRMSVQRGTLSIIIMAFTNFDDLESQFGTEKTYQVIMNILEDIKSVSNNKANIFHYKDDNEIALLIPNMDYDGASLLCFEILASVNMKNWQIDDVNFSIETIFGYSSLGDKKLDADKLIEIAENLIEMQKL